MKIETYDIKGQKIGQTELPKDYFGVKVNPALMAQSVGVYLSNQRKARAKTKTRSEVDRTKAKWFRQKGTGRARHGSRSAPIFVGGGVAHGPRGIQNWERKLPARMKKQAVAGALTTKLRDGDVMVVEDLESLKGKTKEIAGLLEKLFGGEEVLLVTGKKLASLTRAGRNISSLQICQANLLNAYEILRGGKILLTIGAVKSLAKQ